MIDLTILKNAIEILKFAISKKIQVSDAASHLGFGLDYWNDITSKIEAAYYKGSISEDQWSEFRGLRSNYESLAIESSSDNNVVDEIERLTEEITRLSQFTKNDNDKTTQYQLGGHLIRLKDLLSGRYIEYVESVLPFSLRTSQRYTKIFYDMGGTYLSDVPTSNTEDIRTFLNRSSKSGSRDSSELDPTLKAIIDAQMSAGPDSKESSDEYDDRSHWWLERNESGEITRYHYQILIRDQDPMVGSLSTQQMEEIYRKYPYVTQNTISQDFPYLTFVELRKILRCFNITKDRLFPQHIVEKYSEEKLAEFALKAKESAGMKRMVEKKSQYFEKRFKDTQADIFQLHEERKWIDGIIDQYFNERKHAITAIEFNNIVKPLNVDKKPRLFCLMSDLHIGKRYDHPLYGRGYNKDIARERFHQMAEHVCKVEHEYEHLTVLCGGDLTESIMENGLHNGIHRFMDLFQEDQIFHAIDLFHEFFATIFANSNFKSIELLGLEGNHDRIGVQRHDDKNRTAAKIIYKIIEREWRDKIKVVIAREGILNEVRESICLISHHGDSNLAKRKGEELVNLFGRGKDSYHLVIQGHFHHLSCKEGTNFVTISLPSICSADTYSITEFAQNAQPGFLLGHQSEYGVGFDFKKITLY